MNTYLLALETSTHIAGCALVDCTTGRVIAHTLPEAKQASAELMRALRNLMNQEGVALSDIVGMAVSVGPGRFTGVRLGMMLVQSMAYARGCPVIPINTLAVLGHHVPDPDAPLLLVEDAFMNEVFWAKRLPGQPLSAPQCTPPDAIPWPDDWPAEQWHVAGSGLLRYPECWPSAQHHPNITATPEALGALALQAFQADQICLPADLKPVYVRDEVVSNVPKDANTAA